MYIYRGTKYDTKDIKKQKPVEKAELVYRGHKTKDNK